MVETVPTYRHRLYGQYRTMSGSEARELDETYYKNWARVAHGHFRKLLPATRRHGFWISDVATAPCSTP